MTKSNDQAQLGIQILSGILLKMFNRNIYRNFKYYAWEEIKVSG